MSVKYRLVERKNLGKDNETVPTKLYAQVMYSDLVEFETFLLEVADGSGVGSAQVKAVLDRINIVLQRNLAQGRRVNVGELGNFRYGVGSSGVEEKEEFSASLIREPRIIFAPGKGLRVSKKRATYAEGHVVTTEKECDKPHAI